MLIRIATDSDQKQWNQYVCDHPNSSPYHRFAWKKAIENSYSHGCYYLIAQDDEASIIGVLPAVYIKPPLASGELCSLPFCDRGEALGDTLDIEKALEEHALEIATRKQIKYEYRSSLKPSELNDQPLTEGAKVRMLLTLPETSRELLSSFKSKLRSQIKKAEKNGLVFETGRSQSLINDFYRVFTVNMRDLGSPTHSKKWFEEITKNYGQQMVVSIVYYKQQPVGAGIVLFNGDVAAIPWASTLRKYNRLSPNMLLYWSLLQYSTDQGSKTFDFGRSSYGEGTYRFKQQWGAQPVPLNWKTYLGKQLQSKNSVVVKKGSLRTSIETIWSNLPLPMTVLLGSRIRKYISL